MKNVTPAPCPEASRAVYSSASPMAIAEEAWQKAVEFHGHACPGLAVGCRAALAGIRALNIDDSFLTKPQAGSEKNKAAPCPAPVSPDEELVCVPETDACGVDAIQCLLGCTSGKGNLRILPRGKSAFRFYHRPSQQAVRVLWSAPMGGEMTREERMAWFLSAPQDDLLRVAPLPFTPPHEAVISSSVPCAGCGEMTSEAMIKEVDGSPYCLDCLPSSL